jgi:hypothetical protein
MGRASRVQHNRPILALSTLGGMKNRLVRSMSKYWASHQPGLRWWKVWMVCPCGEKFVHEGPIPPQDQAEGGARSRGQRPLLLQELHEQGVMMASLRDYLEHLPVVAKRIPAPRCSTKQVASDKD